MAFDLPNDVKEEYKVELTPAVKRKILGENAARLYGIDITARKAALDKDEIGVQLQSNGIGR